MGLETILDYKMSTDEGEVFGLALTYERLYQKILGEHPDGRNSLPRRTDPRKCYLFRHCWKMRRETRGLFEFSEYKNFIHANLLIIKMHEGHIEPNCVCGDKAWIRYKVWKRRYDQKMAEISATPPPPSVSTTDPKLIAELDKTKKFLFERCEGEPSLDKFKGFIDNNFFKFWVVSGKVSPFYVALSPYLTKLGAQDKLFEICSSSRGVIENTITEEIRRYFAYEFSHEVS